MINRDIKKFCIYFHLNSLTDKVFYVGIGTIQRASQKYKRSEYWKNYVKKYGLKVKIIDTNLTWDEACEKEKHFISLYGRKDIGTGALINQTNGGDGTGGYGGFWKGKKRPPATEETIKKCKENTSRYWLGKSIPEDAKQKIANKLKGSKLSEETKNKLKGRTPWNKGLKGVQVSTRKGVKTGKPMHRNTREALMRANTGSKRSEEFKQLMSKVHKGKTVSVEVRGKISKSILKRNNEQK